MMCTWQHFSWENELENASWIWIRAILRRRWYCKKKSYGSNCLLTKEITLWEMTVLELNISLSHGRGGGTYGKWFRTSTKHSETIGPPPEKKPITSKCHKRWLWITRAVLLYGRTGELVETRCQGFLTNLTIPLTDTVTHSYQVPLIQSKMTSICQ